MLRTPIKTKKKPLLDARTTVSLEQQTYDALAEVAYNRRVSIGCVMREAVTNYINDNASKGSKTIRHSAEPTRLPMKGRTVKPSGPKREGEPSKRVEPNAAPSADQQAAHALPESFRAQAKPPQASELAEAFPVAETQGEGYASGSPSVKDYSMAPTFVPELHILPSNQRSLWPALRPVRDLGFVLYGGTAVSLRLGHRVSVDFDFFTERSLDHPALIAALPFGGRSQVIQEAPNTLTLLVTPADGVSEGIKVSFFGGVTNGRIGCPEVTKDGVMVVASLVDLLGSKFKTFQQRIEKKDYLDIYAMIERGVSLEEGLAAGRALYGRTFQPSEALKAMAYFGDGNLRELPAKVREALIKASSSVKSIPMLTAVSASLGLGEV